MRSPQTTIGGAIGLIGGIIIGLSTLVAGNAPDGVLTDEQKTAMTDTAKTKECLAHFGTIIGGFFAFGGFAYALFVARDDKQNSEGQRLAAPPAQPVAPPTT